MMEKATADCRMIMESPVAAASICIKTPEARPREIAMPVLLPLVRLSVSTNMLSGPGMMVRMIDALKNDNMVSIVMVVSF